jgi:hypothetical protein
MYKMATFSRSTTTRLATVRSTITASRTTPTIVASRTAKTRTR